MRRLAAFAFAGGMACLSPALAQPAATVPAQGSEAIPESRIAAAIDLLKANHATDNVNAMLDTLAPIQKAEIRQRAPALSDQAIDTLVQKMHDVIMARQDELLRLYAIEYANHFSEQELHDLAAFYRSDLGQKYIVQIPALLKESTPVVTRWLLGVLAQEQQNILDSLPKPEKKT